MQWSGLPGLPALAMPRLPLAAFRRRFVVRGVFVALMAATLLLAVVLLAEEKQRALERYEAGFRERLAALAAQLRHPSGQLALLNPLPAVAPAAGEGGELAERGVVPLVLPFSALDFDDPFKARQAVEMSGCALTWSDGAQLCVAVGSGAWAGGFVYLVASFASPAAQPRERGVVDLAVLSHAVITVQQSGSARERWVAPFEAAADAPVMRAGGALRGRLAGFVAADDNSTALDARARPDRDFRAWLWQDAECSSGTAPDCARPTLLSIRLPVATWREGLFRRPAPAWPPADLARTQLRLQWLGPGGTLQFDSATPGASAPFALDALAASLAGGETLRISKASGSAVALLRGRESAGEGGAAGPAGQAGEFSAPWLLRLIQRLPVPAFAATGKTITGEQSVATPGGRFVVRLEGDGSGVERSLSATATRLAWYVVAMLGAIALAWLIIEVGFMRRMATLTRRAAALSINMQDPQLERRLGELDVADLRGKDELGILAGSLAELLQRVKDGARREHIRAEQEREQWHAVGHEIMSPLQSLLALHGAPSDASHRYLQRMQQAVRVLYGTASPSEAFAAAPLQPGTLDLDAFARQVADNAAYAGISEVRFAGAGVAVPVLADEYKLEDVVTHVLRNADRHRLPGTAITLALIVEGATAELSIHNQGEPIGDEQRERIFEYGVSGSTAADGAPSTEHRGQGLFVARTYMAKMGGTIHAVNTDGGVAFVLRLPRAA